MPAEPRLLSLIALLALAGCKTTWRVEDVDEDGYVWPEDCWEKTTPNGEFESAAINPGATEIWYDDVDLDCSGGSDYDQDGDGYESAVELGLDGHDVGPPDTVDCDDSDANVRPDAAELCDGVDNDCDGLYDDADDSLDDTTSWYVDRDQDGYGDGGSEPVEVQGCTFEAGYSETNTDCDDDDETVNPDAVETCDERDQDCDGDVDEDATDAQSWCEDGDSDGYGDPAVQVLSCALPDGYVAQDSCDDCDDSSAAIYPSEDVVEACDEVDNDCDGDVDEVEDELDGELCYVDDDLDGWGADDGVETVRACDCPGGYAPTTGDCDDGRDDVNPDASEQCDDGVSDENCNELYDDLDTTLSDGDKPTWYLDDDGDGYGSSTTVQMCAEPSGYVDNEDDCDDGEPERYPSAPETCGDGLVNDCLADETDTLLTCLADEMPIVLFEGVAASDALGAELSPAGDLDGDGYPDALVSATGSTSSKGSIYVLYGEADVAGLTMTDLQTTLVRGTSNADALGSSTCALGDTDGDGYDDFAAGAPTANLNGSDSGGVYIIDTPLATGTNSVTSVDAARLMGTAASDMLSACAGAADWNGDGTLDLVAGAPGLDTGSGGSNADKGAVYLLTGTTTSSSATDISTLAYATLTGADAGERAGTTVAALGDIDGDGVDDLAVGAPDNDDKSTGSGAAYVAYGPVDGDVDLTAIDGYYLYGASASAAAGTALGAADLDGDGNQDVLVGAPGADEAYVLFGATSYLAGAYLSDADIILSGASAGDESGAAVSSAGDVDGDGSDDLLVGAPGDDTGGADAGAVHLLFGPLSAGTLSLATDADITWTGSAAGDGLGAAISGVGDLDGNDYDDLLLGAPAADDGSTAGAGEVWLNTGF